MAFVAGTNGVDYINGPAKIVAILLGKGGDIKNLQIVADSPIPKGTTLRFANAEDLESVRSGEKSYGYAVTRAYKSVEHAQQMLAAITEARSTPQLKPI